MTHRTEPSPWSALLRPLSTGLLVFALTGCGGGSASTGSAAPSTTVSTSADTSAQGGTLTAASVGTDATGGAAKVAATPTPPPPPPPPPLPSPLPPVGTAGLALTGLTPVEFAAFNAGKISFTDVEKEPKLGPVFNGRSCAECHSAPAVGGAGSQRVTRFGKSLAGVFDALDSKGGSLLQSNAVPGVPLEAIPAEANVTARRRTTGVYGFGLIEAIPDADITAYAAAQAKASPGQAGQVNFVTSPTDGTVHVGRFGWKSQQALLVDFSGDAYANEMGVSNRLFPIENRSNASAVTIAADKVEDAPDAAGVADIDRLTSFMRYVAPYPSRASLHQKDDLAAEAALSKGYTAFNKAACAVCHRPSWVAGGNIPELRGRRVWAFSDFLLHDIGTGDGIVQGSAPANKLRTSLLMGVTQQFGYLHDGSARTVEDAIARHQGEAKVSLGLYNKLTPQERAELLAFVKGL